jgi:4-hydroxythreonine-4-phosphate dehydrogenase
MPITIGISLGDVTGIGPEVTLKALPAFAGDSDLRFVLVGDAGVTHRLNQELSLGLTLGTYTGRSTSERISICDPLPEPLPPKLERAGAPAASAALQSIDHTGRMCLRGDFDAMVTAPVSKEAIVRAGHADFVGHTEYLSELAGTDRTVMMLLGQDDRGRWLRVALATTHVAIRKLADRITTDAVELAINRAAQACMDLGLPRRRVAVCGLNPHAGEGGKMGTEEIATIAPAVERAKAGGIDVVGPMSADALFYYAYRGDYDAVVAMYHDQGLAPLKMVCFENGVNWTLGLPFIRTSPDHGTAYDIAGQGRANASSMIAAMRLAIQLARQRGVQSARG